jgi:5-methylcytosine-specific restriction endonuclease McrA
MKKQSKAAIYREHGIPESLIRGGGLHSLLRYKNPPEKGVYWYYLSRYVRQRDVDKWGTCISCGRYITFETCQAGHFMPASSCGRDLLFDLTNVNAECSQCNAWDETHLLGYAENLDKRYGQGTSLSLRKRRDEYKAGPLLKDWKGHEYAELVRRLPNYPHNLAQRRTDEI